MPTIEEQLRDAIDGIGSKLEEQRQERAQYKTQLEEVERKLNLARVSGIGDRADHIDHPAEFQRALKAWNPQRAADLREFDYSTYSKAFSTYVRHGLESLSMEERKAMQVSIDPDGGFLAPTEMAHEIIRVERDNSVIRGIARTLPAGAGEIEFPASLTRPACGWVGETGTRSGTDTPSIGKLTFTARELYAMPEATQKLIDDSAFNVEAFLSEEIGLAFAEEEDAQFIAGDGIEKPRGFTTYSTAATADASRAWGTIQHIATGSAGAWPTNDYDAYDKLVDVVQALRPAYRRRAAWVMGTEALTKVRKLKDDNKQPLWQPSMAEGQPDRLLGYPVHEAEQMPGIGANSLSVAFADWQRAYWILDRTGVRVLRDPYTNKPYVRFYTTKRLTGGLADSNAIKLLKFSAS